MASLWLSVSARARVPDGGPARYFSSSRVDALLPLASNPSFPRRSGSAALHIEAASSGAFHGRDAAMDYDRQGLQGCGWIHRGVHRELRADSLLRSASVVA